MIGDMLNNNNRRNVKTREDQIMWLGKKYRRDKKSGYYVCCSGNRKRLHVAMWESAHGVAVPPGCVIHHLDWDKSNNTVENLICVTVREHNMIHNIIGGEEGRKYGYELIKSRGEYGVPGGIKSEIKIIKII